MVLDSEGFDLWADGYDESVARADRSGEYPFAGYYRVLNTIYARVRELGCKTTLDAEFGTGALAKRLYRDGLTVYGVDFSPRMVELAQAAMPGAKLYLCDFSKGLPEALSGVRFDCITATYSLHHLTGVAQAAFISELVKRLVPTGELLIGDVAFESRAELEACRLTCGDRWDDGEEYFVIDELRRIPGLRIEFERCSHCAGVITVRACEQRR